MGKRGTFSHVEAIAKKKPKLQEVIDNIEDYSAEEIDALKGYQAWIRKHLKLHLKDILAKQRDARVIASLNIPTPAAADRGAGLTHDTYQYEGTQQYVVQNGPSFTYEVDPGDLFLIYNETYVKMNSTMVACTNAELNDLIKSSKLLGKKSIIDYNIHLQEVLDEKINGKLDDPRNSDTGWASSIREY